MAQPSQPAPTFTELYERIRALPEGMTGEILQPGVLETMSRPGRRHRRASRSLLRALDGVDRNVGGTGWWIEVEAEIRLPGDRLAVPDLTGWRVERLEEPPEENPIEVVPDWCAEILSPTTQRKDRLIKLPLYAASGVPWTWLVVPDLRAIEVYETKDGLPALRATSQETASVALPPFDVEIDIAKLWMP